MLDIHSHIIFGIDDGSKTFDDSKLLIDQAISNGIDYIIATPHYNDFIKDEFFNKRLEHCKILNDYIKENKLNLHIEFGCEISFQINWDRFNKFDECVIKEKYLLLEFSDIEIPDNYIETVYDLRKKGYTPIIAHPERSYKIQDNFEIVKELHRMGCLFQLDAGSLKNHFGKETLKTAKRFLDMNLYHFIGSDAHSPRGRNYNVFEGLNIDDFQNEKLRNGDVINEQVLLDIESKSIFSKLFKKFF